MSYLPRHLFQALLAIVAAATGFWSVQAPQQLNPAGQLVRNASASNQARSDRSQDAARSTQALQHDLSVGEAGLIPSDRWLAPPEFAAILHAAIVRQVELKAAEFARPPVRAPPAA